MNSRFHRHSRLLLAFCASAILLPCLASAKQGEFTFSVISHASATGEGDVPLLRAIQDTDNENHAFIVANGMKDRKEPCNDALYQRRIDLLKNAKNGLVVSLAASDWAECPSSAGKTSAVGKLNRLRELLFMDDFSLGSTRIPVVRQSSTAKFRSYPENARWEIEDMMFATVNIPANNNHFVPDAGRNSEFEDRLIANRDWLRRIFLHATKKKSPGIVLFCDANPLATPSSARRDGYAEVRRQLLSLAKQYDGKVLLVHGESQGKPGAEITWEGNLGVLDAGMGLVRLAVNPAATGTDVFSMLPEPPQKVSGRQGHRE
jgi:hypothetical protein